MPPKNSVLAKKKHRTISTTPRPGHLVKPREIIEIQGLQHWTLAHRRTWNMLLANAWGEKIDDPNADFEINIAELRGTHDSNDQLRDWLRVLQKTLAVAKVGGKTTTVQMLGGTTMDDDDRETGVLTYDFPKTLVRLLRRSDMYGQLNMKVMGAFTSKYSLALYELVSARAGLNKMTEEISLATLRDWLGVPHDKLEQWAHLYQRAIDPALREVNTLSPYEVHLMPVKRGRKVERVILSWAKKTPMSPGERAAVEEVNRHREGRRQRLAGTISTVVDYPLRPVTVEKAQALCISARLDVHALEQDWRDWIVTLPNAIEQPDGHFLSFVKTKCRESGRS
jgi:hypothetical protein